jgi:hypothetical protein
MTYDVTVYLVLDDFGEIGRAYRETDEARADFKSLLEDLRAGQFHAPVRVVAFNTAEGWSRDVSEDIAREIAGLSEEIPASARAFVDRQLSDTPSLSPTDDTPPWPAPHSDLRGGLAIVRAALQENVTLPIHGSTIRDEAEALAKAIRQLADQRDRLARINPA